MININDVENNNVIVNRMIDHKCSRCGDCCDLFIPFTQKELSIIKEYVIKHNIEPYNRLMKNGDFKARCCFYNEEKRCCMIYPVRPFVCRDFKCERKDWQKHRNLYEKRAKYNSTLNKKPILASFDDLIYKDYAPIITYLIGRIPKDKLHLITPEILHLMFENVNRLDLLQYFDVYDENNNKINLS